MAKPLACTAFTASANAFCSAALAVGLMPRGVLTGSAASKGTAYRSADLIWLATRFQNSSQTWEPLDAAVRSEEHTSELQSPCNLVCRLLLEKKKKHKD